jgi:hypothetical protein
MRFGDGVKCPGCGLVVSMAGLSEHECEDERWLLYQLELARPGIERVEEDIACYLLSVRGRFESWYAARHRHASNGV